MASSTITRAPKAREAARPRSKPFLFVALWGDRPAEPGARFCLEGSATVMIGRGPRLSAVREGSELHIQIADPRLSAKHLRLTDLAEGWLAEDLRSKNGTLIDGRRMDRQQLLDGMIIEAGETFLLFRHAVPCGLTQVVEEASSSAAVAGDATLSPPWRAELDRVAKVAPSRVPILIRGETGAGKEVLASAIHRWSGRRGPYQAVNCAAIPENLVESELFGHRRGAFSGAVDEERGILRNADGGTLLLDEIGDLRLPAQAVLLRVLESGEFLPVGGGRPVKVDLRVIAATHRNLDEMVERRLFRADLLARLSGYVCEVPPLRQRREDFSLFVASLLSRIGARSARFTADAARALLRYDWPHNVRELEKALSAAIALSGGEVVELEHLPEPIRSTRVKIARDEDDRLRDELIGQLRMHGGNISAVARAMGKARMQIQRWMGRFELDAASFRR